MSQIEINETQLLSDVIAFRLKRRLLLKERIQKTRTELIQLRKLSQHEKSLINLYISKGVNVADQIKNIRSEKEKVKQEYDAKASEYTPKITLLSRAERYLLDVKAPQVLASKGVVIIPKEPEPSLVKEIEAQKN
jgi:hypothetical protein